MADNWFDALGKPVSPEGIRAAQGLLVAEGLHPGEVSLTLDVVARDIAHDEPDRAIRYMRRLCGVTGGETLTIRALATLCAPPVDPPAAERRWTPAEKLAAVRLIEEMEAMADYPSEDELAEIERLGREHPFTDEERDVLQAKVRAVIDRVTKNNVMGTLDDPDCRE